MWSGQEVWPPMVIDPPYYEVFTPENATPLPVAVVLKPGITIVPLLCRTKRTTKIRTTIKVMTTAPMTTALKLLQSQHIPSAKQKGIVYIKSNNM